MLLEGYRALDITDDMGNFCGRILADLGVDVVKIEAPGGDRSRIELSSPGLEESLLEKGLFWFVCNAGKKGITLDLETDRGKELFLQLVAGADFVVESFSPGHLDSLGLGYSKLRATNQKVILTSITHFGQSGPYKDFKADDLISSAMGGWMYMCGDEDRPPVRFSIEQAYFQAGVQAVVGTLIAHHFRERTGEGQHVDVSVQESVAWTLGYPAVYWHSGKHIFPRAGHSQRRINVRYRRLFPCKDGYVAAMVGCGVMLGPMHTRLVEIMAREGMAGDMQEVDWGSLGVDTVSQEQVDHWENLMEKFFLAHSKTDLKSMAVLHELLLCPVNTIPEVLDYEQPRARDYWTIAEAAPQLLCPAFLFLTNAEDTTPRTKWKTPALGEHNEEIYLAELGLSKKEMESLKERGII